MPRNRVIMVYPHQGFSGTYVKHMPLGLLYAAAEIVKDGFEVKILDTRVLRGGWRQALRQMIDDDTLCVGVSVMSGAPIKHAIEIGRYAKSIDPDVPVVWGGPHTTFYPESVLRDEWSCDYVVSGYASQAFHKLCKALQSERPAADAPDVSWREADGIRSNYRGQTSFEYIGWRDIPYHLIEDYGPYGQLDHDKRIFSMYSAYGCPYQCSFCSSPKQYSTIEGKRWVPLTPADVVDHVQHVAETYGANYIYFIDDDSFPKLSHVESVIDEIGARDIPVGLGFRGARINEIKRMSDAFLDKLAAAGTDIMHIGAESGSDRVLKILRKDCTRQEIVDCNRKLARHPEITAAYNFMMGIPTETLDDLKATRDMMLQLIADHPNCIIFPPNKFRPLPGTELYSIAEKEWGYKMPSTLEAWSNIEVEADAIGGWYEEGVQKFCNLLLVSSYFIDNKAVKVTKGKTPFLRFARLINWLYRPIARFRLERGITFGLVEYRAYRLFTRIFAHLQRFTNRYSPQS